ncbi:MAG: helix-turn-helix domain-containing protein [Clostridium sp.]|uniref:helix-turn-helix domain-containing protein n=1 Tax=Clostridium sp. TaxID=1506 RepID=UPI003D6D5A89
MDSEILSPGKKLKKIRKGFKIRQHEITGCEISRELISVIENDKCGLSQKVAEILAENINKICKERNIDFHLTAAYLLEDVTTQANRVADEYINFLNNNDVSKDFTEDIRKIDLFLMNQDIPEKKSLIFEKIGDILKNQKEYYKSHTYYIKAFEHHNRLFNDIRIFNLLQKIGNVCIRLTNYKEALDFNSLALIYNNNVPEDLKYKILFNNALCYIYLEDYRSALNEINHIDKNFKNLTKQDIFELNSLKVSCYRYKKFFSDALEISNVLSDTLNENEYENTLIVVGNTLDIYSMLKDTKNIKIYIDKQIYLLNKNNKLESPYFCNVYKQIAVACNLINNTELSKEYYKKAIKACKQYRNKQILEYSLDEFLDILIKEQNSSEINDFKNEILELISLDIMPRNDMSVYKLINFYNSIKDTEGISSLLDFILDENKK